MRRVPRPQQRRLFTAKSPTTGKLRRWEGLVEMGTAGPYAIVSVDEGPEESYSPGSAEYAAILNPYNKMYGDD